MTKGGGLRAAPATPKEQDPLMATFDRQEAIDKIHKLKTHAESAKDIGNEAEAHAFANMIQKLLSKYQLSMSEVEHAAHLENDTVIENWVEHGEDKFPRKGRRTLWTEILAALVGKANGCVFLVRPQSNSICFVGFEVNAKLAEHMFTVLARAIADMAERERRKFRYECQRDGCMHLTKNFKASFLEGFLERLRDRFAAFEHENDGDHTTHKYALVRTKSDLDKAREHLARMNTRRAASPARPRAGNAAGHAAGIKAANSMPLNRRAVSTSGAPRGQLGG